jgi:hypothetical protein
MYHDQGLIPVKTIAFESAVNVTLGLPHHSALRSIMEPPLTSLGLARLTPAISNRPFGLQFGWQAEKSLRVNPSMVKIKFLFTLPAFLAFQLFSEAPLLRDFMGINGHFHFDPIQYAQTCKLARNYHNLNWDVKKPGDPNHLSRLRK